MDAAVQRDVDRALGAAAINNALSSVDVHPPAREVEGIDLETGLSHGVDAELRFQGRPLGYRDATLSRDKLRRFGGRAARAISDPDRLVLEGRCGGKPSA